MFLQLQRILTLLLVLMTQAFDSSLPQAPFFIDSEVTESQESSTKKLALLVPNNQTTSYQYYQKTSRIYDEYQLHHPDEHVSHGCPFPFAWIYDSNEFAEGFRSSISSKRRNFCASQQHPGAILAPLCSVAA